MLCAKDIMKKAKLILYLLAKKLNRITYEAVKGNSLSVCFNFNVLLFTERNISCFEKISKLWASGQSKHM